ncbi:MAG: hypothetical protein U1E59_06620 [Amaricoccus sp.]
MSRRRRWLAGGLAAAGLLLAAVALNTLAHYEGWGIARLAPEALSAKLAPFYRVTKPAGTGRSRPRSSTRAATGRTTTSTAGRRC